MKKLVVIADWCNDSIYSAEYRSAVSGFTDSQDTIDISFISTTQSSINTSFLLAQAALTEARLGEPNSTVIHMGNEPRSTNDLFIVIKLTTGVYVCGINSEYTFSLIKDLIDKAFVYKVEGTSSGFKSRDIYSRVVAHLLNSLEDDLELEEVHTNTIQASQDYHVGHIDSFGNIITTIKNEELAAKYSENDEVKITIGDETIKTIYKKNIWSGDEGQLIIGPGSFGLPSNPYISIVKKEAQSLIKITVGQEVVLN